jgi:hypothetical protein
MLSTLVGSCDGAGGRFIVAGESHPGGEFGPGFAEMSFLEILKGGLSKGTRSHMVALTISTWKRRLRTRLPGVVGLQASMYSCPSAV